MQSLNNLPLSKAADGKVNIEKKYKYSSASYVDKHSEHVGQITSVRMKPPHVCHSLRKEELRVKTFPQAE